MDLAVSVEKMSRGGLRCSNEKQPEHCLLETNPGANILCESSGHFWTVKKPHLESAAHVSISEPICLFFWAAVMGFSSCQLTASAPVQGCLAASVVGDGRMSFS